MFIDKKRAEVQDEIRRRDQVLFAHILTPGLFFQAAWRCGLPILRNPLNLINLAWLAVSAARNPDLSFADILALSLNTLQDSESFPGSLLAKLLCTSAPPASTKSCHHPRTG